MNIHEHQAKEILKKYGAVVPNGVIGFTVDEIVKKAKKLNTKKYVLKAQIHAGGRGKAGGVKILDNIDDLTKACKILNVKKPLLVADKDLAKTQMIAKAVDNLIRTWENKRKKLLGLEEY